LGEKKVDTCLLGVLENGVIDLSSTIKFHFYEKEVMSWAVLLKNAEKK